jgi:hypothetical protein
MLSKSKRYKEHAKARQAPLEALIDEFLLSILEHSESKRDLLNICLVSRRLYILTIEVLYRDLSLDLSTASHRRLMQRLVHIKACLPQRIQILRVEASWQDLSFEHSNDLHALFHLITNFKLFGWTQPLVALYDLAEIIHTSFSQAIMEVTDNDCYLFDPETEDDSGAEDNLWFFSCVERHVDFQPDLPFIPINILQWMPRLSHLMLAHDQNCWIPGMEQELPSPQHTRDI